MRPPGAPTSPLDAQTHPLATPKSPKITQIHPPGGAKIAKKRHFGPKMAAIAYFSKKQKKLELPHRVEVVSTPQKREIRHISAKNRHFKAKTGYQTHLAGGYWARGRGHIGVMGVEKSIFQNRPQIASRWVENRFEASRRPHKPPRGPKTAPRAPHNTPNLHNQGPKFSRKSPILP